MDQICRQLKNEIEILTDKRDRVGVENQLMSIENSLSEKHRNLEKNLQLLSQIKNNGIKVYRLKPLVNGSKFIQILIDRNDRNDFHWICISNMRNKSVKTVRIYDSNLKRINHSIGNYSQEIKFALKRMFADCPDIKLELPLVCQCFDGYSGGVYAIAFAQALCEGKDPSQILFSNCGPLIRCHLLIYLQRERFEAFPTRKDSNALNHITINT